MVRFVMRLVAAGLVLGLALLTPALAAKLTLSGDVTYRERIALPREATLVVSLLDLADPSKPRVSAKAAIATPGQVPLTFNLNFDEDILVRDHSYGLRAEIVTADGALWFTNPVPVPVDPRAPVTPLLIVTSFAGAKPAPQPTFTDFFDVTWQAVSIGAKPVVADSTPSFSVAADMRAGGSGGCNSWFAQADVEGQNIAFSAIAATRRACLSDALTAQESAFFAALESAHSWTLDDDQLVLRDAGRAELARFKKSEFD